jgi:hypothetical protein
MDLAKLQGVELKELILTFKSQYYNNEISCAELHKKASLVVNEMNNRAKVIAKKFGKKHTKFSLANLLR